MFRLQLICRRASVFMKLTSIIFILIITGCCSCSGSREKENPEQKNPEALQEKGSYSFSKRSYDDLVESLYEELADNTPELKGLEYQIKKLNERKPDSTETFEKFDNKNNSYYNSAKSHYEAVKDSVLKEKIKSLVAGSQTNYNNKTSGLTDLVAQLRSKEISLNAVLIVSIFFAVLPIIENLKTVVKFSGM